MQKFYLLNKFTDNPDFSTNPYKVVCINIPLHCSICKERIMILHSFCKDSFFTKTCEHTKGYTYYDVYKLRIIDKERICKKAR